MLLTPSLLVAFLGFEATPRDWEAPVRSAPPSGSLQLVLGELRLEVLDPVPERFGAGARGRVLRVIVGSRAVRERVLPARHVRLELPRRGLELLAELLGHATDPTRRARRSAP